MCVWSMEISPVEKRYCGGFRAAGGSGCAGWRQDLCSCWCEGRVLHPAGEAAKADASVFNNTHGDLTVNASDDFFSVPFNVKDTGYGIDVVLQFTPQGGEAPVYVAYHVNDIGK